MKFIDLIKEDVRSFKEPDPKEEKRVKTIFKALKKGVIEVQHPRTDEIIKFRYYINDRVFYRWEYYNTMEKQLTVITNNVPEEGITIYCDDEYVVDKCMPYTESVEKNPTGVHLREMFMNKLKKRFDVYDVKLYINNYSMKFVLDKPKEETLNEEVLSYEDYVRKQEKKGRTVYKALKRGTIGGDDPQQPHFKYELPDKFSVFTNNIGIVIEVDMIKIKHLNRGCLLHSSDYMSSLIRKRFHRYGIVLTSSYGDRYFQYDIDSWESPNE
jgi:hypothetical protein